VRSLFFPLTVADACFRTDFLARVLSLLAQEGVTTPTMLLEGRQAFFQLNHLTYLYTVLNDYKEECAALAQAAPVAKKPRVASAPSSPVRPLAVAPPPQLPPPAVRAPEETQHNSPEHLLGQVSRAISCCRVDLIFAAERAGQRSLLAR
jgi:hypothetical protein